MSTNLLIQYILVGAILLSAVVWVIYKAVKRDKKNTATGSCHGCSLSQVCGDSKRNKTESESRSQIDNSVRAKCNDNQSLH